MTEVAEGLLQSGDVLSAVSALQRSAARPAAPRSRGGSARRACAPTASVAMIEADRPPMWKSGIALRQMSSLVSSSVPPRSSALSTTCPCLSGTPFGAEVVPDVRSSSDTSLAVV